MYKQSFGRKQTGKSLMVLRMALISFVLKKLSNGVLDEWVDRVKLRGGCKTEKQAVSISCIKSIVNVFTNVYDRYLFFSGHIGIRKHPSVKKIPLHDLK
jgi:hypothetical protein